MDEPAAGAVSSASNVYVRDVCEKSSLFIADLSKTAGNKAFIERENKEPLTEVRSRKPEETDLKGSLIVPIKSRIWLSDSSLKRRRL